MKRFTHDADLRGMVVLRSLGFQLVPFKLHRFRKQRPCAHPVVNFWCSFPQLGGKYRPQTHLQVQFSPAGSLITTQCCALFWEIRFLTS
ncbi:hypothetical protein [Aeromonas salmonicida]|uniref:hypothetical protein n=1 Tax=Aeromonas salmonicida TaxID=645 RepID=UPI0012D8CC43|nr:hypothetical protein [Aeromonas salmonicida]